MPKRYRVEITRSAESDVEAIFDFIAQDNRSAAEEWVAQVERQVRSLERFPKRCPLIPEAAQLKREYRHLIYGSYRTIFRIEGSTAIILRVIHGAQLLDTGVLDG